MNLFTTKDAARVLTAIVFVFATGAASSAAAAVYTVDRTDDATVSACTSASGDCTLRGAIAAANATNGATINFDASVFAFRQTINLSNGQLTTLTDMTIIGTGADKLIIRNTLAGNRVISINQGTVALYGMTFTGGNNSSGGGAGIFNNGMTTVTNCVVSGNTTSGSFAGGGIGNNSSLTLTNSTVSNNSASAAFATGGINSTGSALILTNSTVSGNSVTDTGANNQGGVYTGAGTTTITNSTITNNSVGGSGNAGGIYRGGGTITLKNTIVAANGNNTVVPDVATSGVFVSSGGNIIGNVGAATGFGAADLKGTSAAPFDPRLSPLGNYGGGTLTHAPLSAGTSPASPAIDGGNSAGAPATDQRGAARAGAVDIGAYEVNPSFVAVLPNALLGAAYLQTITADSGSFVYTITSGAPPPGMNLTASGGGLSTSPAESARRFDKGGTLAPAAGSYSIAGTPTAMGTYPFTITATNGANTFSVNYTITVVPSAPTAASVTISGRALTATGRGIRSVSIRLTDGSGNTRTATTTAFGYYRFADVNAGETYIITAKAKRYAFSQPSQVLNVGEDAGGVNFVANP